MRRAEDTGQLATAALAAEGPAPSRYRNPGDVIGLIAAAIVLAAAVIAVTVAGGPVFGLASGLAAAAVTGCVAVLPWLQPGWRLAAFGSAVLLSEVLIGLLKSAYNRARPPGSLVATSGASFPSGHSIAASVTVLAMVIVLAPPGRRQVAWGIAAVTFAVMMALSRAYLGAHWLSDATAGLLLGISCAMITATAVDQAQRRYARPAAPAAARSVPSADRL